MLNFSSYDYHFNESNQMSKFCHTIIHHSPRSVNQSFNHECFRSLVEFTWPVGKWIKGNFKQVGYYRVQYDDDNWNALIKQLNTDHTVSIESV